MSGFEAIVPYLYAAATAATVASTVSASRAQAASQRSSAQAAEYNAEISRQQAEVAHRNAGAREDALRREGNAKNAHLRAAIAESGFDPGSGTLGLVQEQSADNAELDALMIRYAGNLEARGLNSQGILDKYQATAARANAANTVRGGNLGAAAGLLSSAANYYRAGYKVPTGG